MTDELVLVDYRAEEVTGDRAVVVVNFPQNDVGGGLHQWAYELELQMSEGLWKVTRVIAVGAG